MPSTGYILSAIFLAAGITFALRLIPFGVKSVLKDSALVANLAAWLPMGQSSMAAARAAVDNVFVSFIFMVCFGICSCPF